jgi:hypothetical protein
MTCRSHLRAYLAENGHSSHDHKSFVALPLWAVLQDAHRQCSGKIGDDQTDRLDGLQLDAEALRDTLSHLPIDR